MAGVGSVLTSVCGSLIPVQPVSPAGKFIDQADRISTQKQGTHRVAK